MSVSINGTGSITGIDQGFNVTTGSVGIGTDNPGHILDVYNSAGTDCLRLNVNGSAGGSNKQNAVRFSVDGDVKAHMGLAVDAGRLISGSIANDFCLKGLGSNNILFATNSSERLRITSAGDMGLGTATPTSFGPTFQVAGTDPALLLQDTATAVDYFGVNVTSGITQLWYDDAAAFTINTATAISGSGLVERLRIKSDGDVFIGNIADANDNGVNSSYRTITLADTTNGAQLHLRGQSPKLFMDVTSGGTAEIYYDTGAFTISSGEPGNQGSTERFRITSGGQLKIPAGIGPQITFENQHGHTGDAVISTYDDGVGTLLCLGSNFYFSSGGAETRYNTSEESAGIIINRTGTIDFNTGDTSATATSRLRIRTDGDVIIGPNDLESQLGSRRRLAICDTTNGALVHIRGQSPAAFFDVSSGGTGRVYCDNADFTIYPGTPNSEGTESIRIKSNGQLQQRGFVNISSNRRLNGTLSAGTYTFGTVTDAFAGILYITGTHNNGHSTRIYIINKSTNGTGVTLVGDGNDYSPARTDVSLSGNNLQVQVYYGNRPVIHMVTLRGTYTHTLAE